MKKRALDPVALGTTMAERSGDILNMARAREIYLSDARRRYDVMRNKLGIENPATVDNRLGFATVSPALLLLAAGAGLGGLVGGGKGFLMGGLMGGLAGGI